MRTTIILAIAFLTASANAANAGQSAGVVDSTSDRAVERPLNGGLKLQIQAATGDSSATLKTGWTRSITKGQRRVFDSFSLAASAPLATGGAPTSLFGSDGFTNAFVLTGKFTNYSLPRASGSLSKVDQATVDGICKEVLEKARQGDPAIVRLAIALGKTEAEAVAAAKKLAEDDDANCDSNTVLKFAKDKRETFDRLMGLRAGWHRFWGISGSVGYRKFEFLEADFATSSADRVPLGASFFVAALPKVSNRLVGLSAEFKRQYKDAGTKTRCPQPAAGATIDCKTGIFGQPAKADSFSAFVEVRQLLAGRAMSLKFGYDFTNEKLTADVPIYIFPNADGGPSGGIRFGWRQGAGGQVGVFVTQAFKLFTS